MKNLVAAITAVVAIACMASCKKENGMAPSVSKVVVPVKMNAPADSLVLGIGGEDKPKPIH